MRSSSASGCVVGRELRKSSAVVVVMMIAAGRIMGDGLGPLRACELLVLACQGGGDLLFESRTIVLDEGAGATLKVEE